MMTLYVELYSIDLTDTEPLKVVSAVPVKAATVLVLLTTIEVS